MAESVRRRSRDRRLPGRLYHHMLSFLNSWQRGYKHVNDINPFVQQHADIRQGVRDVCSTFDSSYWQKLEESASYPEAFVQALTQAGWLAALIPEEFGGSGVGLLEASIILEEINRSGANSGACHAQMYTM